MLWRALLVMVVLFAIMHVSEAASESTHADRWCTGAREHRLHDGRRVDCLTATHAIEVEFSDKWAEGIGQALSYAIETARRPGLVLIPRGLACRHWWHVRRVVVHYALPLDIWMTSEEGCR